MSMPDDSPHATLWNRIKEALLNFEWVTGHEG